MDEQELRIGARRSANLGHKILDLLQEDGSELVVGLSALTAVLTAGTVHALRKDVSAEAAKQGFLKLMSQAWDEAYANHAATNLLGRLGAPGNDSIN